jgi:fumarate hydratase class I
MSNRDSLTAQIYALIQKTSTHLMPDVRKKLISLSLDHPILKIMHKNMEISENEDLPICQDTGYPYFNIQIPFQDSRHQEKIINAIEQSILLATQKGLLRPNTVDPITNQNYGNNLGAFMPYVDIEYYHGNNILLQLLLKGGGSENVGGQYSLPLEDANAGRDTQGIVNTVLYHIQKTQGLGCSPGILGIGIGGDRVLSMKLAKKQLFRDLDDSSPNPEIAKLENEIFSKGNQLGIGVMGLGGFPTLLGVKIDTAARHPASFFVSISYFCWVARRGSCTLNIT